MIVCLLLSFLGICIASPLTSADQNQQYYNELLKSLGDFSAHQQSADYLQYYNDLLKSLSGGNANRQSGDKVAAQTSLSSYYNDLLKSLSGGSANRQSGDKVAAQAPLSSYYNDYWHYPLAKKDSSDEVTALLENYGSAWKAGESKDAQDRALMQSLVRLWAKVDEKVKKMDSKSAEAQSLKGLFGKLWNTGKNYLCSNQENPTESSY